MKKYYLIFLSLLFVFPISVFAEEEKSNELISNAVSGLLMEQSTGEILFEKDKDKQVPVASMTKMVAQTIILERIESGKIKWDDIVEVSKNAADMGGSQIYLTAGEKMSVRDLFKGISMASGNDATVAMAEYIAGDEASFVKLMNKKVKELGLKNTQFKNCTGLDEDGHFSSAYDMAVIARNLVNHEEILKFSSVYEDYLRENTENKFWLVNTNKLVKFYSYIDGLKTGYTGDAGYCLTATGMKNDMRLISVVMGEENTDNRTTDTLAMLDYGFNMYSIDKVVNKDKSLGNVRVNLGDIENVDIMLEEDITILNNNQKGKKNITYEINTNNINAPVKKGDVVGKLDVYEEGRYLYSRDITVMNDIEKANIFKVFIRNLRDIMGVKV